MSDEFDQPGGDREGGGWESVRNRCRVLAAKIANELRNKRPEHFVDKVSLADIHSSLERAADVLAGRAVGVKQERRREKLLQRVWPKMMIGAMFVLEVVWIGFLAYVLIVFISLRS
jgi:hypothetical protein